MIITRELFYTEEIDRTIPKLDLAAKLFLEGKDEEADHAFAEYFKSALDPDHYFDGGWQIGQGESTQDTSVSIIENADMIVRGKVRSCSYTYDYNGEIDWNFNGAPDKYKEWLWQLNRHHIFKIIGYAYLKTGDEKYADAFQRHMTGWLAQAECPMWPVPNRSSAVPTWRTISAGIRGGN